MGAIIGILMLCAAMLGVEHPLFIPLVAEPARTHKGSAGG